MKAATCVADITPQCPVYLCGYVGEARKHPAKGVHDHPLAVSLLLEIEDSLLLFVSIDVVTVGGEKVTILKKRIKEVIGLDDDLIIINAIHSHSCANGFADEAVFGTPDHPEYFQFVCDQIINSIMNLKEKLVEVDAVMGTDHVQGYYSKRSDRTLPYDDNAAVVKFMREDRVIAAMCNFNCHATVLGPQNMQLSADLIGKVRSLMAEELQVVPYTFTGASGDISNRQYRQGNDFAELERVGNGVANILKQIKKYEKLKLEKPRMTPYDYHIHYDTCEYREDYRKGIREAEAALASESISEDEWKLRTSEKLLLEMKLSIPMVDFHVRGMVLHIGELTIVTFPGELASCFGLELRKRCMSKQFLLIGYANDYQGYFIEAEEYGKTYETKASNTPRGESENIVNRIGDLL